MQVAYRQHREQRDASFLQRGNNLFLLTNNTENNKTLVPYRTWQRTRKCKLLTHNTENNEMPVPHREATCFCLQTTQRTMRCWFFTRQDRDQQDASCLQTTYRTTRCQFLTGQDKEQQNASWLQTTQRTTRCQILTERQQSVLAYRQHREQPRC